MLGAARRRAGDPGGARAVLQPLAGAQPGAARVHVELGMALAALGEQAAAAAALARGVALQPLWPEAWRALGDVRLLAGDAEGADAAYARSIETSVHEPVLIEAGAALAGGNLPVAERLLRGRLKAQPNDVAALRMLAELGVRLGRYREAEALLERALHLAPGFAPARHAYALVLYRQGRAAAAVPHLRQLVNAATDDPALRNLLAAALAGVGDAAGACALYEGVMTHFRDAPKIWMSYGHALRTAGRRQESVAAYRRAIALSPSLGESWWSLANLKTEPFEAGDVAAMRAELARAPADVEDRLHLHYALGRALEEARHFADSFTQYSAGASIRRGMVRYSADATTSIVQRAAALFTPAFFAARGAAGCDDPAPIFIVGLPRAGSTLIEQVLASHSLVEGTMELPELPALVREFGGAYPDAIADLTLDALAELGQRYIGQTRLYRRTARPFFIDKLPNNWLHVGLIRLILPQAKVIDARRDPMATCFSAFKQHFARGQHFSYDLRELGLYYRDYLALMAHADAVLPGFVHRVQHETLIDDLEGEVRRLLAFCGLDFEPTCMRFWETGRAVRTASSEQVRRPLTRAGLDQWRNYEPWLGELRQALASAESG